MKHTWKITLFLTLIFLCSQMIGLAIINEYIDIKETSETGKTVLNEAQYNITGILPPAVENESSSWIYILFAVAVGTAFILLIVRFRQRKLWKLWFSLSVVIALFVSFAPFMKRLVDGLSFAGDEAMVIAKIAAFALAVALAYYKIFRQNIVVHNVTEIFIYGGIAALVVPIMNIYSIFILLIAISIYDMIAVWQSKHMVKMAQFQTESKVFGGLMVPYVRKKDAAEPTQGNNEKRQAHAKTLKTTAAKHAGKQAAQANQVKNAILGGGDIAFPLLFAGVILKTTASFVPAIIVSITSAAALFCLFYFSKPDRFYPAMPFISAGCFAGFLLTMLL